jgi:integrase
MAINSYIDEKVKKQRWKVDFTLQGQRIRQEGFKSAGQAQAFVDELRLRARLKQRGLLPPEPPKVTLIMLRDKRAKDDSVSNKTMAQTVLAEAIKVLGPDLRLVDLKRAHLREVREHFEQKKLKVGTVVNYLGYLSAALHSAPEHFAELENWRPPRMSRPMRDDGRQRVLTKEELGKLFGELKKWDQYADLADMLRMMLLTGARRGELTGLTLQKINQDWRTLQIVRGTKNGLKRVIPISDTAFDILKRREAPLLTSMAAATVYWVLEMISREAGVLYGDQVEGGWVAHDLRHTAATVIETAGVKYSTVAALLGHKRRDQTATYTHSSLDDLRKAVRVLENWCQEIDDFLLNPIDSHSTLYAEPK